MSIQPVSVILNITHGCNLKCPYCYYAGDMKQKPGLMSIDLIRTILELAASSHYPEFAFVFHGGEPLLRGVNFFEQVLALEKSILKGKRVENKIQTNGTLIDEEFISLINRSNAQSIPIDLCVSIDGPEVIHDRRRIFTNGQGTYLTILKNMTQLHKHGIPLKVLTVFPFIDPDFLGEYYSFYKSISGLKAVDFLIPEKNEGDYLLPRAYFGKIFTQLFEQWYFDRDCTFLVRIFYSIIRQFMNLDPGICIFFHNCVDSFPVISVDIEGIVTSCDNFPDRMLGKITADSNLEDYFENSSLRETYSLSENRRLESCRSCRWFSMCNGGCPSFSINDTEPNYYCEDFQYIFDYIKEFLENNKLIKNGEITARNFASIPNPFLREMLLSEIGRNIFKLAERII